jgi:peptidoglycan/xylan/chitin deacetylase (PgdA/CDA1 family)
MISTITSHRRGLPGGPVPTTSRRALLRAGLLAASVPLVGISAQRAADAGPAPVGPNGVRVRPRPAAWVKHGRIARAAGMEREVDRCGSVRVLWGGATSDRVVALTFDDGPSQEWTAATLDALSAAGARATFFVVGRNVRRFPDLVRRQHAEGHELGNHSDTHADLSALSEEQVLAELRATDDAVLAATGVRPRVVRPPFGHLSGAALAACGQLGHDIALWTSCMKEIGLTPQGNVDALLGELRPGGVVLSHDGGDQRRAVGLAALPGLLAGLQDQGYRTVTVSELLALDRSATTGR